MRILFLLLFLTSCVHTGSSRSAHRDLRPFSVELEGGALWQNRNDVRIPGDTGTGFSIADLIGEGEYPVGRVTADWDLDERHAVRVVLAPLEVEGTGSLQQPTDFAGGSFQAGVPTEASYEFNNYRIGYRYTFLHRECWRMRVGGTLFVRDAQVKLDQPGVRASDSDIGLVPLVNFAAEYFPSRDLRLVAELDGLASPQGRAVDFSLKAHWDLTDRVGLSLGYRTIEGGADNDDVFSFAWLNQVVAGVTLRF